MVSFLFVGVGGFVGAVARYWVTQRLAPVSASTGFPHGTLLVNLLGCFLLGFLAHWIDKSGVGREHLRQLLLVGVLGGFTTFSAFSFEGLTLLGSDRLAGIAYISLSIVVGLFALWLGQNSAARIL